MTPSDFRRGRYRGGCVLPRRPRWLRRRSADQSPPHHRRLCSRKNGEAQHLVRPGVVEVLHDLAAAEHPHPPPEAMRAGQGAKAFVSVAVVDQREHQADTVGNQPAVAGEHQLEHLRPRGRRVNIAPAGVEGNRAAVSHILGRVFEFEAQVCALPLLEVLWGSEPVGQVEDGVVYALRI